MKTPRCTLVLTMTAFSMACGNSGGSGTSSGSSTGEAGASGGARETGGSSARATSMGGMTSASSGGTTRASSSAVASGGQSAIVGSTAATTAVTPDAGLKPDSATSSGGAGRSGGTTSAGGTSSSGGASATGGSTSTSTSSPDGRLTPQEAVKLMAPGWNLGNSFDAIPNETSWGNPTPNQNLIKAVHAAGFKLLRLAVGWTDHLGPGPSYTIDAGWMNKVKQTAQWAVDDGMYVFVNTHHDSDGGNGGWVTFGSNGESVAKEVTAVWTQIANAFKGFNSKLMFECFNEPNYTAGRNAQAETDLNMYLEACFKAIRDTGGANSTRIVMIQPIGASPIKEGIQNIQKVSFINDPNLVISLHTYFPTNFGLSTNPYQWGSASDYTKMQDSLAKEIRVWLPTQVIFIGEWGSMNAQPAANRAAHAQAYAQDTTTAGVVPIWWDNGGSGSQSFSLFDRNSGAVTQSSIVSGIMTGVKNGLASPNNWATKP